MNAGKVNTLKLTDPGYPEVLRQLYHPPREIFYIGAEPSSWQTRPKLAVVGSRKISVYGEAATKQLVSQLAELGIVIISGLAYGVDSVAHRSTIDSNGTTVAVLAGGLDMVYPAANQQLANKLVELGGTVISEYSIGTPSYRQNFIARNRLVSGLADALLITEASIKSGTLHTAKFALEQGKTVMAVPGNITSPGSEGTNNLIKAGAMAVTNVEDVLFGLKIQYRQPVVTPQAYSGSPAEKLILKLIQEGLCSSEDLASVSRLSGAEFSSALTMLEISGYIRALGGGNWTLA